MNIARRLGDRRTIAASDGGAALAELAFVIPFLMIILVGIIEVGRFAEYGMRIENAARAGAQYGAQDIASALDTSGIIAAATNDTQSVSGLTVTPTHFCTCADGAADANCATPPTACSTSHRIVYVRVVTSGTLSSLLSYPGLPASLSSITVNGLAIMRVAE